MITGLHHITLVSSDARRTADFCTRLLGLRLVKKTVDFDDPGSYHLYFGDETGSPGSAVTYFEWPGAGRGAPGIGGTHHYALAVPDDETQLHDRERLLEAGLEVTPGMDRTCFRSIYTSDPDGHVVELATARPGFAVDEPVESLGRALELPPWLEERRATIERSSAPIPALGWEPAGVGA